MLSRISIPSLGGKAASNEENALMIRMIRAATVITLLGIVAVTPGCLIGSSSRTNVSGRYVGPDTLAQIQPGKSEAYVTALLGDPSDKIQVEDGTSIWKWRYTETRNSSGTVIFLVASDSKTETQRTTYVEFNHGTVVKAWHD
jgi:outer membrane protein assembly factor BamE (lipoprotein component of BamABCDE complex)